MADQYATCRGQFSNVGKLSDASNSGPKVISECVRSSQHTWLIPHTIQSSFNVFAISVDLGNVTAATTDPVVWAVGMLRDPAIQSVTVAGAPDVRSPYWRTEGVAQDLVLLSSQISYLVLKSSLDHAVPAGLQRCRRARRSPGQRPRQKCVRDPAPSR